MKTTYTLRRIFLLICICTCMTAAQAQTYVPIPDNAFGTWLSTSPYASAVIGDNTVGWELDITDPLVMTDTGIYCGFAGITDLTGIENFVSLRYLDCDNNLLTNIPPLPSSLTYLDCSSNQLSYLPTLSNLKELRMAGNQMYALPYLAQGMTYLDCGANLIGSIYNLPYTIKELHCTSAALGFIDSFPADLTYLDCYNSNLTSVPAFPPYIQRVYLTNNHLTSLPALPYTLWDLHVNQNLLTSLPTLPNGLLNLDVSDNPLRSLPAVLPNGMYGIVCRNDSLTSLPTLPTGLVGLTCDHNQLTTLPALPSRLQTLNCQYNELTSLPALPATLRDLYCNDNPALSCLPRILNPAMSYFLIRNTNISCVPNRFTASTFDINPGSLPLCTPGTGCDFYYNIAGNVHNDTSVSCLLDSLRPGPLLTNIKVRLKQNGNVIQQMYTLASGVYSFKAPPLSSYTVDIDTAGLPVAVVCPSSGIRPVALTATDTIRKYENFGTGCRAIDYGVVSIRAGRLRLRNTAQVNILAGNMALIKHNANCGSGVSGTVTTTISNAGVHYTGPAYGALTPSSVSGNTLTYTIADLSALHIGSLDIMVSVDSTAVVGSTACVTSTVSPSVADQVPADNTLTQCFPIVNSYDPNHKDVYPATLTAAGGWLTYTIRFQNTGNDTAYLVVLRDTLSQYLDASSFQYLSSSHHAVIQLDRTAMVFTFPHIDLVDSGTNAPLSEGWIQYRIRANANLPLGTQVKNTAYIYFDQNAAIATNTTINTVTAATACSDTTITRSVTICYGDTFRFAGIVHTVAGSFRDTLARAGGCDSIYVTNLTVRPEIMTMREDTICAHSLYIFGGDTLGVPGMYMDTLTSVTGCDSIVMLMLEIHPAFRQSTYDTICAGSSLVWHGRTLTTAGYYSDTAQTLHGCDSVVGLWLYISPLPAVTLSWDTLIWSHYMTGNSTTGLWCEMFFPHYLIELQGGSPAGGTYSGNGVQGDTIDMRLALQTSNGLDTISYLYTDARGCSATARAYLSGTFCDGIEETAINPISLYPNPNTGSFTLQTSHSINSLYTITDVLGKTIAQSTITTDGQNIDLHDAAPGVYTLYVKGARPVRFTVVR